MRVLFVTHNVPRAAGDAAGSFVLRLAVALQALGSRVEIVAPGAPGLPPKDQLEGVLIHRVRYAAESRMTLAYEGTMVEQVRSSWGARFALVGMLRALRRHANTILETAARDGDPFDVVHAHWWFPSGLALWRGLPKHPARVVTMHGSDVRLAVHIGAAQAVMRAVLGQFDVHTAVSSWLAAMAMRIAPAHTVHVTPMPVDTRLFTPVPPADHPIEDTDDQRHGILFVGRLNVQKGIADVLSAMTRPVLRDTLLDIVGDGPDRAALETQVAQSGLTLRVRWHGTLTPAQLAVLYRRARVVVMPSREEGLGLVAVEAQLSGTPVVGYASGGLVDVVKAEHGGALVPVGNIVALAEELAALVHDSETSVRRGAEARAYMESRFQPDVVAAQFRTLYAQASLTRRMRMGLSKQTGHEAGNA